MHAGGLLYAVLPVPRPRRQTAVQNPSFQHTGPQASTPVLRGETAKKKPRRGGVFEASMVFCVLCGR